MDVETEPTNAFTMNVGTETSPVPEELTQNAILLTPDGGVKKVILREGSGDDKPAVGDEVSVHYVGTLLDGSKFDSSRDRNDLFKFKLGQGSVIKAWDEGVATMKRGELCKLICRSDYAYGKSGSPPKIPPDATLIFEVELFDWKGEDLSEDSDGSIIRSVLVKGDGYQTPNEGAQVQVDIRGTYEGRVFDERSLSYSVGDASEHQLPEGIDVALRKFKKGEKSLLTLKSRYAFGSTGSDKYNIPAGATVKYEVYLKEFEKAKESWDMDAQEKLSQSELAKSKGTSLYKDEKYGMALKKYKRINKWLDDDRDFNDEQKKQRASLRVAAHLNCALCCIKLEDWGEVKEHCNKALEFDSNNEKALFRLGQAFMATKEWTQAKNKFQAVINVDPENKAARNQLTLCDHNLKVEREKEKKLYSHIFSKLSKSDNEKRDIHSTD